MDLEFKNSYLVFYVGIHEYIICLRKRLTCADEVDVDVFTSQEAGGLAGDEGKAVVHGRLDDEVNAVVVWGNNDG